MKKLPEPSSRHSTITGVRLTRDDLDLLIELVKDDDGVFIADGNFAFDSVDELIEKRGTRLRRLKIGGVRDGHSYDSVTVEFDDHEAWLHGRTGKAYYEVRDFLQRKRAGLFGAMNPWLWGGATWVFLSIFGAAADSAKKQQQPIPEWPFSLSLLTAGLIFVSYAYRRYALGLTLTRAHQGGFWKRNSDNIWLLVLGAVLGIASTLVSQKLFH
jgi:hypothetical protein